ncbi:TadE/TadG family type IV pilus assembly protein [Rubinisphaera sp. JC750]|uniref:TadE/TadG family type IV pilus assembly protein n=1 Tax=Rubinisphaera sp. JC750 TaxID=2898658 RepID=UPI0039657E27
MQLQSLACPDTPRSTRRGAVFVESAIVASVVFLVLLTGLNLTMATLRYNALGEAARRAARAAIVKGAMSEAEALGPDTIEGAVSDDLELTDVIRPTLIGMPASDVQMTISWPDGDNEIGSTVTVQLQYNHALFFLGGAGASLPLTATSVMQIVH